MSDMSERWQQQTERIARYYEDLVSRYGHSPRACDYGRASSQAAKFSVLADAMPLTGRSVLDVGCGFADFCTYLRERYGSVEYTGIDVTSAMIEEARRLQPDAEFIHGDLLALPLEKKYDFVTANGIFYLLGEDAESSMLQLIRQMFDVAETCVAFNSLSSWAPHQEDGEFYADPLKVVEQCRSLTNRVVLRHDYLPHDFTIYLFKSR